MAKIYLELIRDIHGFLVDVVPINCGRIVPSESDPNFFLQIVGVAGGASVNMIPAKDLVIAEVFND